MHAVNPERAQYLKMVFGYSPKTRTGDSMNKTLPLAAIERLIKQAGAHRVAEGAKIRMREVLEEIAGEIAHQAIRFANHAGRTTVKAEDVKLAAKQL